LTRSTKELLQSPNHKICNGLPQDIVNSTSVTIFKRRLDKYSMEWI